ncbi:hypothetical protein HY992_00760 [Candidatus Micrarchaeota archaeon]|nr:hypothetical protein [Candidatus Micrarchaeota archaeon]
MEQINYCIECGNGVEPEPELSLFEVFAIVAQVHGARTGGQIRQVSPEYMMWTTACEGIVSAVVEMNESNLQAIVEMNSREIREFGLQILSTVYSNMLERDVTYSRLFGTKEIMVEYMEVVKKREQLH